MNLFLLTHFPMGGGARFDCMNNQRLFDILWIIDDFLWYGFPLHLLFCLFFIGFYFYNKKRKKVNGKILFICFLIFAILCILAWPFGKLFDYIYPLAGNAISG